MIHMEDGIQVSEDSTTTTCALVVRRKSKIYLTVTWIFGSMSSMYRPPHPSLTRFDSFKTSMFKDGIFRNFHLHGMSISYAQQGTIPALTLKDPDNHKFDFFEEKAQVMLWRYCGMYLSDSKKREGRLNVEEAMMFLKKKVSTCSFPRMIKFARRALKKWSRSSIWDAKPKIALTTSRSAVPSGTQVSF